MAVVARRLGVAPATLRTWDRRYGLGPSTHSAGSHRRYSSDDISRLMVMRSLTLQGLAPADAAQVALEADLEDEEIRRLISAPTAEAAASRRGEVSAPTALPRPRGEAPSAEEGGAHLRHLPSSPPSEESRPPSERAGDPEPSPASAHRAPTLLHGSRPRLVSVSEGSSAASDIVDAALRHDEDGCVRLLRVPSDGDVAAWWTRLVEPALSRLAERTVLAQAGEAPEAVLTAAALRALRERHQLREELSGENGSRSRMHPSRMRQIVLIFAAPDEPQPLAAHSLAGALAEHGVVARIVTGPPQVNRILELALMVRPVATVMVSSLSKPELGIVSALNEAHPDLPIFVGLSAGADVESLPLVSNVQRVRSFTGLLHEVLAICS